MFNQVNNEEVEIQRCQEGNYYADDTVIILNSIFRITMYNSIVYIWLRNKHCLYTLYESMNDDELLTLLQNLMII